MVLLLHQTTALLLAPVDGKLGTNRVPHVNIAKPVISVFESLVAEPHLFPHSGVVPGFSHFLWDLLWNGECLAGRKQLRELVAEIVEVDDGGLEGRGSLLQASPHVLVKILVCDWLEL